MTNSNSHTESIGTSVTYGDTVQHNFELPNDFKTLGAMKVAIEKEMLEMRTTGAETLRSMLLQESEALGLDPMEVLTGSTGKKPRARKSKKRDE